MVGSGPSKPTTNVVIESVRIIRAGEKAEAFEAEPYEAPGFEAPGLGDLDFDLELPEDLPDAPEPEEPEDDAKVEGAEALEAPPVRLQLLDAARKHVERSR